MNSINSRFCASLVAVPIFNIDKRPFALLCAYNAQAHAKRFVRYTLIFLESALNLFSRSSKDTNYLICELLVSGQPKAKKKANLL